MRKYVKRAVSILFAVLLLASMFPFAVFADPISAVAIANGFAQAITAYGASNGVGICFDGLESSNTSQIGENLHELWKRFREENLGTDDYLTIAEAIFPRLYNKAFNAAGAACVAISIADTYVDDIDAFWNWLLAGPAEMVKVDNRFQWHTDSEGQIVTPNVYKVSYLCGYSVLKFPISAEYRDSGHDYLVVAHQEQNQLVYALQTNTGSMYISPYVSTYTQTTYRESNYEYVQTSESTKYMNKVIPGTDWNYTSNSGDRFTSSLPNNPYSATEIRDDLSARIANNGVTASDESLTLRPTSDTGVIDVPDVNDPDYGPIPYYGPLGVPWNDILFGPGTGVLNGEQAEAVADAIDGAIVQDRDKTVPMANERVINPDRPETDDPISTDPDDYAVLGLGDVFPFCIPYDIYDFLSALAAEPVAPHFTATLSFPQAVGGDQTIDLDFDTPTWNQLAQLLRLLELLAFIVGLALLTRSMFIRG